MIRIDKYLSQLEIFSRKRSAPILKKGGFSVNGEPIFDKKFGVVDGDVISWDDVHAGLIEIEVKESLTLLIYKPVGYISSDVNEGKHQSWKNLLINTPYQWYLPMIHIAGRLDVDTEGLILVTSDGKLNHRIISPKRHLPKVYLVTCRDPLTKKHCSYLKKGVILDDGYKTKPAKVEQLEDNLIQLTITEGKYHQVKRMLEAVDNEVTHLERIAIGPWTSKGMRSGEYRQLTQEEIQETLGYVSTK